MPRKESLLVSDECYGVWSNCVGDIDVQISWL